MKLLTAFAMAMAAGTATLAFEPATPQAHASQPQIPDRSDRRQQLLADEQARLAIDRRMIFLTERLESAAGQAVAAKAVLEQDEHRLDATPAVSTKQPRRNAELGSMLDSDFPSQFDAPPYFAPA